jgi:hypothetical protein
MHLVKENRGWQVFFDCDRQTYSVYREGTFFIGGKHSYSQVKTYVD